MTHCAIIYRVYIERERESLYMYTYIYIYIHIHQHVQAEKLASQLHTTPLLLMCSLINVSYNIHMQADKLASQLADQICESEQVTDMYRYVPICTDIIPFLEISLRRAR